ncbi:1863_t:CDS:2 [Entrophospora sp. SA101]|nr:1863_t:CDS:2 [Entrophospora sp. SA101]
MEIILRVGILAARDLAPTVESKKYETPVIKKNLSPVWDATFDFKISEFNIPTCIIITVWNQDRLSRDYLVRLAYQSSEYSLVIMVV